MAKNIKINGVTYNGVNDVEIPLSVGGGTAKFMETSDATANADDVAVGATAYSKGAKVVGTLDISGKADKVSGATNNNFASLDGSGNLKDSGKKAADFLETTGGTLTGELQLKYNPSFKGKFRLLKNHSASSDFGTYILDYKEGDVDADRKGIRICASGATDNPLEYLEHNTPYKILTAKTAVSVAEGGTGATSAAGARTNLGAEEAGKAVQKSGDVMTGPLEIRGTAASKPLKLRGITGDDGTGTDSDLYLQYGVNKKIMLGNNGGYEIAADGSTYSGKAANVSGTVAVANGGTGATTAANARTALGIRTYNGNCTVAANAFYGDVTISGVTAANTHIFVNLKDARISTSGIYPVHGYVTANNNVRVYFSNSTASARTYPIHILAVG